MHSVTVDGTAGLPWERAKAFDGAALFSAFLPLPPDPGKLGLELYVDGQSRQRGRVDMMLYPPAVILEQLAQFVSLEEGDLIMTGTPAGVDEVRPGEHFEGRVPEGKRVLLRAEWIAV